MAGDQSLACNGGGADRWMQILAHHQCDTLLCHSGALPGGDKNIIVAVVDRVPSTHRKNLEVFSYFLGIHGEDIGVGYCGTVTDQIRTARQTEHGCQQSIHPLYRNGLAHPS